MDWLKPKRVNIDYHLDLVLERHKDDTETTFKQRLTNHIKYLSSVAQLFIVPVVINPEQMNHSIYLPVNEENQFLIYKDIIPHFKNVKEVYVNNKLDAVILKSLKVESIELVNNYIKNDKLNFLIKELYFYSDVESKDIVETLTDPNIKIKTFLIDHTKMNHTKLVEADEMISLMKSLGSFICYPRGWKLQDNLKDTCILQLLAKNFAHVEIRVNELDGFILDVFVYD